MKSNLAEKHKEQNLLKRIFGEFSEAEWTDWRWQMKNRLRSENDLRKLFPENPMLAAGLKRVIEEYPLSITPFYLSLADFDDPLDPILAQCLPDVRELDEGDLADEDPMNEDGSSPVPGLIHRYPDRALVLFTDSCAVLCRHCMRKRIWSERKGVRSKEDLKRIIEYFSKNASIRDLIISGGDPLTCDLEVLDWFMAEVRAVPHIEIIRIGSRVPVTLPMRIDDEVIKVISSHCPVWFITQFNHPGEVTKEAGDACERLTRAGIPVSNQSVLLKGINDDPEVFTELCRRLLRIRVRPYYLHLCDPARGTSHFRTSVWKGIEIIERMRGHTSGLAVPAFAVDLPGGAGKVTLQPEYLLSASESEIKFRSHDGEIIKLPCRQKS